jgi:hypothetical protein
MPRVFCQQSFGAKKGLVASGTVDKAEAGQPAPAPRELTQAECEAIVNARQEANDGFLYTIEA